MFKAKLSQDFALFTVGDPNAPAPTENALTRLEVTLPLYTGGELTSRIDSALMGTDLD